MLILGIETATAQAGCALGTAEGVLVSISLSRPRRHVEMLVPAIDFACRQAGVTLAGVTGIAVDIGPGLFSGLRVGVATAKALAQALRVPTVAVCSLDLLAFEVRHSGRLIVAAIDARRGEVYCAFYRQVPGGVQRLSPYQMLTPADLATELLARGEDCLLVGDGALRYADTLGQWATFELGGSSNSFPSARVLVELARPRMAAEDFVAAVALEPMYLRRSDAEINWDAAINWKGSGIARAPGGPS